MALYPNGGVGPSLKSRPVRRASSLRQRVLMGSFLGTLRPLVADPNSIFVYSAPDSAPTPSLGDAEHIPFSAHFRASLYEEDIETRPVPPPTPVGFQRIYREQCRKEGLDPEVFEWHGAPLAYSTLYAVLTANSQSVNIYISHLNSWSSTDSLLV